MYDCSFSLVQTGVCRKCTTHVSQVFSVLGTGCSYACVAASLRRAIRVKVSQDIYSDLLSATPRSQPLQRPGGRSCTSDLRPARKMTGELTAFNDDSVGQ